MNKNTTTWHFKRVIVAFFYYPLLLLVVLGAVAGSGSGALVETAKKNSR